MTNINQKTFKLIWGGGTSDAVIINYSGKFTIMTAYDVYKNYIEDPESSIFDVKVKRLSQSQCTGVVYASTKLQNNTNTSVIKVGTYNPTNKNQTKIDTAGNWYIYIPQINYKYANYKTIFVSKNNAYKEGIFQNDSVIVRAEDFWDGTTSMNITDECVSELKVLDYEYYDYISQNEKNVFKIFHNFQAESKLDLKRFIDHDKIKFPSVWTCREMVQIEDFCINSLKENISIIYESQSNAIHDISDKKFKREYAKVVSKDIYGIVTEKWEYDSFIEKYITPCIQEYGDYKVFSGAESHIFFLQVDKIDFEQISIIKAEKVEGFKKFLKAQKTYFYEYEISKENCFWGLDVEVPISNIKEKIVRDYNYFISSINIDDIETFIKANPEKIISISDSLGVGNCEIGTKIFCERYNFGDTATLSDIANHEKFKEIMKNKNFQRVITVMM